MNDDGKSKDDGLTVPLRPAERQDAELQERLRLESANRALRIKELQEQFIADEGEAWKTVARDHGEEDPKKLDLIVQTAAENKAYRLTEPNWVQPPDFRDLIFDTIRQVNTAELDGQTLAAPETTISPEQTEEARKQQILDSAKTLASTEESPAAWATQAQTTDRQQNQTGHYDTLRGGSSSPGSGPQQDPPPTAPTPAPSHGPSDGPLTANETLNRFGNPEHMARYENQKKKDEEKTSTTSTPDTAAKVSSRGGGMANFVSAATKKAVEEQTSEWTAAHAQVFGRGR